MIRKASTKEQATYNIHQQAYYQPEGVIVKSGTVPRHSLGTQLEAIGEGGTSATQYYSISKPTDRKGYFGSVYLHQAPRTVTLNSIETAE